MGFLSLIPRRWMIGAGVVVLVVAGIAWLRWDAAEKARRAMDVERDRATLEALRARDEIEEGMRDETDQDLCRRLGRTDCGVQ